MLQTCVSSHKWTTTTNPITNACQRLKLITVNEPRINVVEEKDDLQKMVAEFRDVFCGDSRLESEVVMEVDENITPSQEKPRNIPMAVCELLTLELEQLEKRKIIEKVHESSDWTSNIVIVR
jgi:hypothetical protein